MTNQAKLDNLTNEGMIDLMYHQLKRAQAVTYHINTVAFWQRWVRR